jgi:hypothetical protein
MSADGSRSRLRAVVDSIGDEKFSALVELVMEAERKENVEVTCKHCKRAGRYVVFVRDPHGAVKSLAALLDQSHGKPAETVDFRHEVTVRTLADLEAMSIEELVLLAGSDDAEWSALPSKSG